MTRWIVSKRIRVVALNADSMILSQTIRRKALDTTTMILKQMIRMIRRKASTANSTMFDQMNRRRALNAKLMILKQMIDERDGRLFHLILEPNSTFLSHSLAADRRQENVVNPWNEPATDLLGGKRLTLPFAVITFQAV